MPATAYVMNNTACPTDLNSCTAGDEVQTRQLNAVIESPGMVCEADENFTVNITAEFSANTNRYDLGLYVAGNGGTISGKTPDAAQCQGGYGKIPPFWNANNGNFCGDVNSAANVTESFTVKVNCTENIVDGNLHMNSCPVLAE